MNLANQGLNQRQKEAVEIIDGPLLIVAPPGSGKTRVITQRIAYLVSEHGIDPFNIVAMTFTNKAAMEMRERLFGRGNDDTEEALLRGWRNRRWDFTVGTFHSFCSSVLRAEGSHIGLDRNFVIYDQEDQLSVVKRVMETLDIDPKRFNPRSILDGISRAKIKLIDEDKFSPDRSNPTSIEVQKIYPHYQNSLRNSKAVDFDDLLMKTVQLFRDNVSILQEYQSRYMYVLVDEFQDTNILQYAMLYQIAGKYRNICVVGDPDQSIYSWRQADVRNLESFSADFPERQLVTLEQNYRSTGNIINAALGVISKGLRRQDRPVITSNPIGEPVFVQEAFDPEREASMVLDEIARLSSEEGYQLGECAVMYRVNAQTRVLEDQCLRHGIACQLIGGQRFYHRKEIKDLIAYLRVIDNPFDEVSLLRIINEPPRGIGRRTVNQLVDMARYARLPLYSAIQMAVDENSDAENYTPLDKRSSKAVSGFLNLINGMIDKRFDMSLDDLVRTVITSVDYIGYLEKDREFGPERIENIHELINSAGNLEREWLSTDNERGNSLSVFLEQVTLSAEVDSLAEQQDKITLITLHQAKGLEYRAVFIVGLDEGTLPHRRSFEVVDEMEEERRLFYVGMTRAKERLYITYPFRRGFRGMPANSNNSERVRPSQFLSDIPDHLQARFRVPGRESGTELGIIGKTHNRHAGHGAPMNVGDHVVSGTFGEGIVVSCIPSGKDYEVTVAFKGSSGIKRLLSSYADLEVVK